MVDPGPIEVKPDARARPARYGGGVFRLLDRFGIGGAKRREIRARKLELAGDLERATALYVEADRADEAARVLLARADAESDPERRLLLCTQAARVGEGTDVGERARRRRARLSFDLARSSAGGALHGELSRIGAELEAVGDWQTAAEAYALAGDDDAEIRVLKEAGEIDRLEARLRQGSEAARETRERAQLLRSLRDLDAIAERRRALGDADAWLEHHRDDEAVMLERDRIEARLLRGPDLTLDIYGVRHRCVLGRDLTIGRAHADIVVPSSAISRQHLRLYREGGRAMVEDLGTRNGTTLAGARLHRGLPVGDGLELELAGRVPCRLTPLSGRQLAASARYGDGLAREETTSASASPSSREPGPAVAVDVAGARYVCPLGPLVVGDWRVDDAHDGAQSYVVLRTPEGAAAPFLGSYRLGRTIELGLGDELRETRGGEVALGVPQTEQARAPAPLRSRPNTPPRREGSP